METLTVNRSTYDEMANYYEVENCDNLAPAIIGGAITAGKAISKSGILSGVFSKKKKTSTAKPRIQLTQNILERLAQYKPLVDAVKSNPTVLQKIKEGDPTTIRIIEENLYRIREENPEKFNKFFYGNEQEMQEAVAKGTLRKVPTISASKTGKTTVVQESTGNIFFDFINDILAFLGINRYDYIYDNLTNEEISAEINRKMTAWKNVPVKKIKPVNITGVVPTVKTVKSKPRANITAQKRKIEKDTATLKTAYARATPAQKKIIQKTVMYGTAKQKEALIKKAKVSNVKSDPFNVLKPLKSTMLSMLNKEGEPLSSSQSLKTIANKFYNNIVVKQDRSNYEIDLYGSHDFADAALGQAAEKAVITGIIEFIQKSKEKKDAGEPLTKLESAAATGAEKTEAELKEKAKDEAARTVGQTLLFDRKTQIILLLIIGVVAYVVMKKIKK